jgi:hypothetical protein
MGTDESIELLYPFYLDADMSMAFAAALTGGVALEEEQIDRASDTSEAMKVLRGNLKLWRAGGIDAGRESSEGSEVASESRQIRRHTDASVFIALYDELRRREKLQVNPGFEELTAGSLVSMEMGPAVAPLRRLVDQVKRLLDLVAPTLGIDDQVDGRSKQRAHGRSPQTELPQGVKEYRQLRQLFEALSEDLRRSGMIDIVVDRGEAPNVVLTLDERFVVAPTLELLHTSRFTVVGKVSEIWPSEGNFVNLYRRSVLSLVPALAQSTAWNLFALLGTMGRAFDANEVRRVVSQMMGLPLEHEGEEAAAAPAPDEVLFSPEAMAAVLPGTSHASSATAPSSNLCVGSSPDSDLGRPDTTMNHSSGATAKLAIACATGTTVESLCAIHELPGRGLWCVGKAVVRRRPTRSREWSCGSQARVSVAAPGTTRVTGPFTTGGRPDHLRLATGGYSHDV